MDVGFDGNNHFDHPMAPRAAIFIGNNKNGLEHRQTSIFYIPYLGSPPAPSLQILGPFVFGCPVPGQTLPGVSFSGTNFQQLATVPERCETAQLLEALDSQERR